MNRHVAKLLNRVATKLDLETLLTRESIAQQIESDVYGNVDPSSIVTRCYMLVQYTSSDGQRFLASVRVKPSKSKGIRVSVKKLHAVAPSVNIAGSIPYRSTVDGVSVVSEDDIDFTNVIDM